LALPAKSVASAAALATAALGATALVAPAAHAAGIGPIFMFRVRAGIDTNCAGGNRELANDGNVGIARYIWGHGAVNSYTNGDIQTLSWTESSSTEADQQFWCYDGSYYYQYYAANDWIRTNYQYWECSDLGLCNAWLGSYATPWQLV
jgi:hypothetical protein